MSANATEVADAVKDTIYKACLLLDDEKWGDFLELCDEDFQYAIKAYSPEINYDMMYFMGDRKELKTMLDMLPKHNTDHSPLKRHATVYTVDVEKDGKTATAVTSLVVYQNMLDGINSHVDAGENHLFLIGKYIDRFRMENGTVKFFEREVRLDTRRLDKGTHWVI
ncbi:MAG: aromatic-ring-hydroxylating dioxygenase subunit beta [Alphaproteobacteria bacterium]